MIPVRMYQEDRPCMGKHQHFPKSTIHKRGWFRSTDLWVMGPAGFLCATLRDEA